MLCREDLKLGQINGRILQCFKPTGTKYAITDRYKEITVDGVKERVYQIWALKDFADVKRGDLGGYVNSYDCISQDDRSWVYSEAVLFNSSISKDTSIEGDSTMIINSNISYGGIGCSKDNHSINIIGSELDDVDIDTNCLIVKSKLKKTEIASGKDGSILMSNSELSNVELTTNGDIPTISIDYCDLDNVRLSNVVGIRYLTIYGKDIDNKILVDGACHIEQDESLESNKIIINTNVLSRLNEKEMKEQIEAELKRREENKNKNNIKDKARGILEKLS